jgi:sec-independent protein translocase protein TatA
MGRFSAWEIAIIVILVLLIFGGRRLPELGRALGKGISNFKNSLSEAKSASLKDDSKKEESDKDNSSSEEDKNA